MRVDPEQCEHYDIDFYNNGEGEDDVVVYLCRHPDGDGTCSAAVDQACGEEPICFLLDGEQPELVEPTVDVTVKHQTRYGAHLDDKGLLNIRVLPPEPEVQMPDILKDEHT